MRPTHPLLQPETTLSDRYYSIQKAFTGSDEQVGPDIDLCKTAWDCRTTEKHGQKLDLDKSQCGTIENCEVAFLDSQVNGAIFMAQRSVGGALIQEERLADPAVREAAEKLKCLATGGGYLVDSTGLGKTMTSCLFINQHAEHADHKGVYRPTTVETPNGAVFSQWCDTLWDNFKGLVPIISNDEKPYDPKFKNNWVSSTAMREAPDSLEHWPEHLKYIFDARNPASAKAVIITPYDTHKDRTVFAEWKAQDPGKAKTKPVGEPLAARRRHRNKKHKGEELTYQREVWDSNL